MKLKISLLHPAQANLEYFLAWFQSLQLPSTQSESPLAPKRHVSFKVLVRTQPCTKCWLFRSGLSDIRINCNRISEGLLYTWRGEINYILRFSSCWFLAWFSVQPWRWRRHVLSKCVSWLQSNCTALYSTEAELPRDITGQTKWTSFY
jgi:hypothetical protein